MLLLRQYPMVTMIGLIGEKKKNCSLTQKEATENNGFWLTKRKPKDMVNFIQRPVGGRPDTFRSCPTIDKL